MLKKDGVILLGIVVLALFGAFGLPRLSIFAREPFRPARITRTLIGELGDEEEASRAATVSACRGLLTKLRPVYANLECRPHRYSVSDATERVNSLVHRYRARPTGGWQISEVGLTRLYRNPDQAEPSAATQTVFVMVTNTLVLAGYTD